MHPDVKTALEYQSSAKLVQELERMRKRGLISCQLYNVWGELIEVSRASVLVELQLREDGDRDCAH